MNATRYTIEIHPLALVKPRLPNAWRCTGYSEGGDEVCGGCGDTPQEALRNATMPAVTVYHIPKPALRQRVARLFGIG